MAFQQRRLSPHLCTYRKHLATHTAALECISFLWTLLLDIGLYYQRNIAFSRRKPFRASQLLSDAPRFPHLCPTPGHFPSERAAPLWAWVQIHGPVCSFCSSQKGEFLIPLALWEGDSGVTLSLPHAFVNKIPIQIFQMALGSICL